MTWNERTTDCLGKSKTLRPTCRTNDGFLRCDLAHPQPPLNLGAIRELVFGPKVLAELAILRRLAATA
jgi:hypothetical protein